MHPVFAFLKREDYYFQPDSSLQTKISSSGMHHPRIFHPCRQNLPVRDASPRDFSSLQTKFPRQGCIDPGFFIPADRIFSSGMHRHGIFHPCRQNLLGRDASPRDFSSLQTKSPRQGCIASGFFIPCRQNLLARDASPPQLYSRLPGAPAVRRAHLNSPQRLPGAPAPDKADSSDFQTAGFHSR